MGLGAEEARQRIGRYEVIKTIGKGAMGVVYKARDPLLDRVVAVKTISSPQGQGRRVRSAFLERFQREAKAAAKMQHPAIVTIFDVGVDEESGAPFMVLEYLPGESLADRLDRVRLPLSRCVQIALDLASALSFAHRQRIVHRDVKPANVLHAGDNRWKLADFGIARMPDSDLTQVGIFMGTPGYSPPEAIREGRYTPQADVFAWGAVFYELLSGRIPYEGPDTKTTNSYVVQGNAPPPTRHDPSIPEPLAQVTMTALQPSDRSRFKDASEAEQTLREAWDRCLTQGLVHPSILAMEETAHDKAPARMHEPRNVVPVQVRPAPAIGMDSAEVTAIDSKMLAKPFVIESQRGPRGDDDDPTTLMAPREEARPTPAGSGPRSFNAGPPSTERKSDRSGNVIVDRSSGHGVQTLPDRTVPEQPRFSGSVADDHTRLIWFVIAGILTVAAAIAVLYFAGVIK
ncbi:MAG TPA: serine/threonine-protein kinase [Kofleriaceae bacterium]|nr:serine/threonine-protein kinase [Kofleriaceae bacterium]